MSHFIDSEAEESEDEMLEPMDKKKLKSRVQDSSDEDDEDDEEKIKEELKDLIDDAEIEEESDGEDSDISRSSKKRKKDDDDDEFDDRIDEEDYDLLEENLGVKVERKRFKRLKRIVEEESEEEHEEAEEERDKIANELFNHDMSGDDDEKRSERSVRPAAETDQYGEEGSEDDESDADDFIVDDDGRPIAEKRKKKKHIFADSALQEAQDIFGVDFDFEEFEKYDPRYEEEEEDEEEDDYMEEDGVSTRPKKTKKTTKKKTSKKSIFEVYEPSELKRGHFTDFDHEIRTTDIPERMQLRSMRLTPATEEELLAEAEWIYNTAFDKKTITIQDAHLKPEAKEAKKGPQTVAKIKKALDFMRNSHFEVPFIAFYRKEFVLPELNINDLWKIYKYDAKWCQLRQRKEALLNLIQRMKRYQEDFIMEDPDAPLPDNLRLIEDEDIKQLESAQSTEELNDSYHHFMLYYSQEIPKMQEVVRKQEKEKRKQERILKRKAAIAEAEENGEEPPPADEADESNDEDEPEERLKQAVRTGPYSICRRAGLDPLAKKFGLKPEQFAKNLSEEYQIYEVDQDPSEPSAAATDYIGENFQTTDEVLKAAQLMVAIQLAREPLVRESVRKIYREKAKISVRPTKKGIKLIDENHNLFSMKYLKDKPIRDLKGDEFLRLFIAEEDSLIEISFSDVIAGNTTNNYVEQMKQLYYRDEFSKNVQDWNALRVGSVEMALSKMVIPDLKKELRSVLLSEAKDCVLRHCGRRMYNWLRIAPFDCKFPDEEDDDWDTSKGLRVMGLAYMPDFAVSAFACIVGPDGECIDHLKLPHILRKKNSFRENEKLMKEADLLAIKNFILIKKPHVVVIGGQSREALMIVEDIKEIILELVQDEQFPTIPVEILENELSSTYSNSHKGVSEFRDYPELLRQAISLARRLQDPLIEFSQLCNADDEILCLRYHPLQEHIAKEDLLEIIQQEFVNRVNEVGVDINKAVQQPYSGNLLQFVCGLGPRKGQFLIKVLKQQNQRLENRTQLVTLCHMGPKVFINCAGFIKIDTSSLGDSEAYVEVLDGSRVHPETYEWARKMAVDALEYEDEDANPAGALEEILETPERLKDLDLDAFAEELQRQGFGNKCITLYDIRAELNNRYKDLRFSYQPPNPDQIFTMLTKETPETFCVGKLFEATVIGISYRKPKGDQLDQANPVRDDTTQLWQCPFCLKNQFPELSEVWNHFDAGACPGSAVGVRVRFDNGISGYIHIKNLSDKHVVNPEERVRIGNRIHCRIVKIEVEKFGCECTSKTSDLADHNNEWRPQKDPFYDTDTESKDNAIEEEAKKVKQRQVYTTRVIIHPSFKNISYQEADKMMQTMHQGEPIIRPSSKGDDHLTVTWKVTDGVHQHIDVREEGKENKYSLGRSLWIGNEEFEDLDEIIARHINPMAAYAMELLDFKYYKPSIMGQKDKAEELLKEQKKDNPNGIPYLVSAAKNYPGKFMLSYLPRTRVRHEYISVTPDGFKFRGHSFPRVNDLFRWFKEHFRDPIPGQLTPSTPRVYNTPGGVSMNQEAIQRVAQNMPRHMLHSLSQVANQTPHYPTTPGAASSVGYGTNHGTPYATHLNTPYTPSGQTPYITPYQTPVQPTPRYGEQTPSNHHIGSSHAYVHSQNALDWGKAAQDFARQSGYRQTAGPTFKMPYKSPRGSGTPLTNSSPRSMSLSGDGTPLYDENL